MPLTETRQPFRYMGQKFGIAANPYDYFHINSIAPTADGDLLISSRNTWGVYKIRRLGTRSSKIVWRMNSSESDFTMGPGTQFYWQHHVRPHPGGLMTVFDNGADPRKERQSRALALHVDEDAMRVTLARQYTHPDRPLLAVAMGSAQLQPDGNMLVGWGTNAYFSEFSPDGELSIAGRMTGAPTPPTGSSPTPGPATRGPARCRRPAQTRRRHRLRQLEQDDAGGLVDRPGGQTPSSLTRAATARKLGFESAIDVRGSEPYFAVQAHDTNGKLLATSGTVRIR